MLACTPDIQHALTVFDATHEQVATLGHVYFRCATLPHAGGALDQDAWTMQALATARHVHNAILAERLEHRRRRDRDRDT